MQSIGDRLPQAAIARLPAVILETASAGALADCSRISERLRHSLLGTEMGKFRHLHLAMHPTSLGRGE
jgi:hypothetical protein